MKTAIREFTVLALALCVALLSAGCAASNVSNGEATPSLQEITTPTAVTPFETVTRMLDSITYVRIDDAFYPVSYIQNGKQLLSGELGTYSMAAESLLNGAPAPEGLRQISSAEGSLQTLSSNGTWEFFPEGAEWKRYSLDAQPQQGEWTAYFKEKLEELHCDSPVILKESTTFSWGGAKAAIVTASNVSVSGSEGEFVDQLLLPTLTKPGNAAPLIYTITALFVQGQPTLELYAQCSKISSDLGSSYVPWEGEELYLQFLTAAQFDGNGYILEYPVLTNMTGESQLRDFRYAPRWLAADIDGDGATEIVFNVNASSSTMCYCEVYRMEQGVVKSTLHMTLG